MSYMRPVYFNSIKVRLKPKETSNPTPPQTQFQFHKGAIKTLGWFVEGDLECISIP